MTLKVLDLFSGIGAYALGVERAGMKVVAFCESEEFPRRVLRKHWPDVPIYEDVRTLTADVLRRDGIAVDVVIGGWPCQDISSAGTRLGLDGERSGLWSEVRRILGELPHAHAILENSSNLLGLDGGKWFGRILGDLAALGRDAEWHCLPAAAFDAPHIRDRLWIVVSPANAASARSLPASLCGIHRSQARSGPRHEQSQRCSADAMADASGQRLAKRNAGARVRSQAPELERSRSDVADANIKSAIGTAIARAQRHTWEPEPDMDRVAPRDAFTVDRIHALGNCNPPIIPETIARALLSSSSGGT